MHANVAQPMATLIIIPLTYSDHMDSTDFLEGSCKIP